MAKDLLARLAGGDRRRIGHADEVAAMVAKNSRLFSALMTGLWSADPVVRMRAADAAEKVTREKRELLQPYKKELLGLMAEADQQEIALASCGDGHAPRADGEGAANYGVFAEHVSGGSQLDCEDLRSTWAGRFGCICVPQ